ncbi:MAG TPA: hypothetical protein VD927_01930 [Chryseosolibacter sp.]|nr:hypothetical protein [Chryseosolibacter sp.]
MTEVFSTNIDSLVHAARVGGLIRNIFPAYQINFDLEDCDKILRIQSPQEIDASIIINIVSFGGFDANVLPDEIPVGERVE